MIRNLLVSLLVALIASAAVAQDKPRFGVSVHPSSVLVSDVDKGSVAAQAGLAVGDVIVRCGRTDIDTIDQVGAWLRGLEQGTATSLFVRRGNSEKELALRFGEGPARLGVTVTGGLSVLDVGEGSIAGKAGVRAGDVLVGFGETEVESFESLRSAIGNAEMGEEVSVRVWREGKEQSLWAAFGGEAEDMIVEEEPARPMPPMPRGMPGLPGMEGLQALMQMGSIHSDLEEAISALAKMNDPALKSVIGKLQSVRERLGGVAQAMEGIRGMADELMGGMGGEIGEMLDGEMPDFSQIQGRLQELMEDGISVEKIQKIIAEEFPGVMIQIEDGFFHDDEEEEKEEPARKR